jgi:ribonuclease P protein component
MQFVFGKDKRVRKHSDFMNAKRIGRRVATPHFTLVVALQPGKPADARLGLVAGRVLGGAVERNRIKRLCRECFRTWPQMLPRGIDLVVIPRIGAHALALCEVRAEWLRVAELLRRRAEEALARERRPHHLAGS